MSQQNNSFKQKVKDLFMKKSFVCTVIAIAAIILVICAVLIATNISNSGKTKSQNDISKTSTPTSSAEPTKRPIVLPSTDSAVSSEEAVESQTPDADTTDTPSDTQSTPQPTANTNNDDLEDIIDASNEEAAAAALKKKEETDNNQKTFDSYIENEDYSSAYELLENFFKDNSYANNSLATFNNYVKYYEEQGLYNESVAYQLDYIEKNDGLENVREESLHYQTLVKTLENVPDYQDSRLATINESVSTWKAMTDALNAKDYTTIINTTKDYIKNGKESVSAYLYLTEALKASGDSFEEAKVYYCYLGLDDDMNQLEMSYYTMFLNKLTMMYYNDTITNEELEYIENDFDYTNYLK